MTAINILLMPVAAHIFSDAGHFRDDRHLYDLASKVFRQPRWNAVSLFQGPSLGGPLLAERLAGMDTADWEGALEDATRAVVRQIGSRPFSSMLVGHDGREPFGMAIEERGRRHRLGIGSMVKSLSCDVTFDPADIAGSGLAMMRAQRERWGVVAGWCEHTIISAGGISSTRRKLQ